MTLRILMAAAGTLIAACAADDSRVLEQRLFAMGTWVDISVRAANADAHNSALGDAEAMLRSYERDYYAWGDGELARLNAGLRDGRTVEVSAGLAEMLRDARRLSQLSGGVFDPGVGALVELWGFHSDLAAATEPPDASLIEAWLATTSSIADLTIRDSAVSADSADLVLDLGGIAKGEAVDRIIGILRRYGIENAIVNAGGDLRALGSRADGPWRIGIQSPRAQGMIGVIELLDGESAFTSGDYERYFDYEDQRLHHILDPTTGYPANHTQAITVIAEDGVTADAAATALFVAGPTRWREVARSMGIRLVLRIDASGRIEATEEMSDRLHPSDGQSSDIMVVRS